MYDGFQLGDIVVIRNSQTHFYKKLGKIENVTDNTVWIRFIDHTLPLVFAKAEAEVIRRVGESIETTDVHVGSDPQYDI